MADAQTDALRWLKRDARQQKPGAAIAYQRALWRQEREQREAAERDAKQPDSAGALTMPDEQPTSPLSEAEWEAHNAGLACGCDGCRGYAAAVLAELSL